MSKAILIGLFQQQPEMHTQQFVEPYVPAKLNEKQKSDEETIGGGESVESGRGKREQERDQKKMP